jgi:hypothetical protein
LQIAAEESVAQMMNRPALKDLTEFIQHPSAASLHLLITIPSVYDAVRYEFDMMGILRKSTLEVCRWLQNRGCDVLSRLVLLNGPRSSDCSASGDHPPIEEKDWKKVSASASLLSSYEKQYLSAHRLVVTMA